MKLNNARVALTALSAFAAPLAAHAGTTALAAADNISNVSGIVARQSTAVRGKQTADSSVIVLAVVGVAIGSYAIYKAVDDDKSKGS